jgi:16S rRNA (adenine(1408)-N(1))-methyltransferase
VAIDLGTGDGRYVLAAAAERPDRLVVGVDASVPAMAEASRRAAAKPRRGGRPNALFVAAAAEALPADLEGLADLVTVHFPWGSLLRGLLGGGPAVLGGIARVMRPGARLDLLLSVTGRDHGAGAGALDGEAIAAFAPVYARHALELDRVRPASADEVAATRSTWGKRLRAGGTTRPAWLVRALRA